ncbi:MAG: hypothetical protein M1379_08675 [Firmicutes bacterium]|nr:hypothetical protein [Bacillota bacterium]
MELFDLVMQARPASLATIGMAKNTGKTVTLNYLIRKAREAGLATGITSIGRDGEKEDAVTREPKPPIWAPKGALVATVATEAMTAAASAAVPAATPPASAPGAVPATPAGAEESARARAVLSRVAETPFLTAVGPVGIFQVVEPGEVEVIGPDTRSQMAAAVRMLQKLGARLVLVDGAVDRVASAAPVLAEAVILATGAVLAPDPLEVARRTAVRVEILGLPAVEDADLEREARRIIAGGRIGFLRGDENSPGGTLASSASGDSKFNIILLPHTTALGKAREIARSFAAGSYAALAVAGAVTDSLLTELASTVPGATVIAQDSTRVQVSPGPYSLFRRRGGGIRVLDPIRLLAVTVNSYAAGGGVSFEPRGFLRLMRDRLKPLPVFDLRGE